MDLKNVVSRVVIDHAIFSFIKSGESDKLALNLYCAGSQSHYVEAFEPLNSDKLRKLILELKSITEQKPKKNIKVSLSPFNSVRIKFSGFNPEKGFKVKAYITGFSFLVQQAL